MTSARLAIRAPNHLGELVLALPALARASSLSARPPIVQVVVGLGPVLEMSGLELETLPMEARHAVIRAARELRRRSPDRGVLLTPSFSGALIFRLAGIPERRGTATDARSLLLTDRVDREPLLRGHRVLEYLELVDPGAAGRHGGGGEGEPPAPRLTRLDGARAAWTSLVSALADPPWAAELARRPEERRGPVVGLCPGGNAPSRRWPAHRFRELAAALGEDGVWTPVFGGAGEADRTAAVCDGLPAAVDLGGRTGLRALAGGLLACDAVVSNDSGPMHLAAALGRPVVSLWGAGDPEQTRPLGGAPRMVGRFDLPCVPCVRNRCPRSGEGYVLTRAERECMHLIDVEQVRQAVDALLRPR
ncbi:MAG TPA: glycosyltransferase family 9 protein [Longimicrobiales bacterium]|nr:glycosyltransferase family 9 protein [Longimicrobiales bacterium]